MGLTQLFTFKRPGQHPARCSIYTVIEMADPWPDMMKNLSDYRPPFFFFFDTTYFFSCWLFRSVFVKVKSIIYQSSSAPITDLKGVIREGCLAVAGDTVISPRPLIGLRIFCNQIYLRQLCRVPGLHNRSCTVNSKSL